MRRLILAVVLLSLVPPALAQIYKWKDAAGTTHYSETPPPSGTAFHRLNLVSDTSATPTGVTAASAGSAAPPAAPADTPANRAKLCADLTNNLKELRGSMALNIDDGHGKPVAMTAERRQQETATAQAQYQQYCAHP